MKTVLNDAWYVMSVCSRICKPGRKLSTWGQHPISVLWACVWPTGLFQQPFQSMSRLICCTIGYTRLVRCVAATALFFSNVRIITAVNYVVTDPGGQTVYVLSRGTKLSLSSHCGEPCSFFMYVLTRRTTHPQLLLLHVSYTQPRSSRAAVQLDYMNLLWLDSFVLTPNSWLD